MDRVGMEEKCKAAEAFIVKSIGKITYHNKEVIEQFLTEFRDRWERSQRKKERFPRDNADWLEQNIIFNAPSSSGGRPTKDFDECCDRGKRQKTEDIRKSYTSGELRFMLFIRLSIFDQLNLN